MATASKIFWAAFVGIVACAIYFARHENIPFSPGPLGAVRLLIWAAFFGFTGYSFYCSFKENLFTTIGKLAKLHWGWQIGLDLYLGLSLMLFVIYLNEGSLLAVLLWLLPTLVFANQLTLLYFALHFDSIVAKLGAAAQ